MAVSEENNGVNERAVAWGRLPFITENTEENGGTENGWGRSWLLAPTSAAIRDFGDRLFER